ncbi:hypothetical protein ACLOJK_004732, partial [Asimina triloba]
MGFLLDDRAKTLVTDDLAKAAWSLPSSDWLDAARWVTGHAWPWLDRTEMRFDRRFVCCWRCRLRTLPLITLPWPEKGKKAVCPR